MRHAQDPSFNYARNVQFEGGEQGGTITLNLTQLLNSDMELYIYQWPKLLQLYDAEMAAYNEFIDENVEDNYADMMMGV